MSVNFPRYSSHEGKITEKEFKATFEGDPRTDTLRIFVGTPKEKAIIVPHQAARDVAGMGKIIYNNISVKDLTKNENKTPDEVLEHFVGTTRDVEFSKELMNFFHQGLMVPVMNAIRTDPVSMNKNLVGQENIISFEYNADTGATTIISEVIYRVDDLSGEEPIKGAGYLKAKFKIEAHRNDIIQHKYDKIKGTILSTQEFGTLDEARKSEYTATKSLGERFFSVFSSQKPEEKDLSTLFNKNFQK